MYISTLLIDVGSNPDQPRPGRLWLRNAYRVHQRLCMAYPSKERKGKDKDFLQRFKPEDFGDGHVHVDRRKGNGFLFRVDPQVGGNVVIFVLSAVKPDWDYAFHNARHFLAAPPEVKEYNPFIEKGQRLKFRLMANPTKKIDTKSRPEGNRRNGKRIPVAHDKLKDWLTCKGEEGGFKFGVEDVSVQSGYIYFDKAKRDDDKPQKGRLLSARFDGVLEITNADSFRETLCRGIGPGKAFGFGLLSIAPVK